MFTSTSTDNAASIAQVLGERDLGLKAKDGSPLGQLVALTLSGITTDSQIPEEHAAMLSVGGENPDYEDAFGFARDQIARQVTNHISFAKNTVAPAVEAYVQYVVSEVERAVNARDVAYTIDPWELPEPLYNEALIGTINKEATGSSLMPERQVQLPMLAPQAIYDLLLSGSGTFDEQVRLWITARGDDFFASVFGSLFSDEAGGSFGNDKSIEELFGERRYGADAALAVFLIAQRLEADVPEGVQMPLAQWKIMLNEYRVAAVNRLAQALAWHESCLKLGTMVLEYNNFSRTVVVVGEVYRRWLEAGGTPEVLAGALIAGDGGYTAASIEERKDEFAQALETYLSMNAVAKRNDSFTAFQRALREGFEVAMRNTGAAEAEMAQQSSYREEAETRFEEALGEVSSKDMEDVAGVCLCLLGKSRFYYSDADKFLVSMDKAAKANPKIDAREAALIATIEYIADYMADQIEVV